MSDIGLNWKSKNFSKSWKSVLYLDIGLKILEFLHVRCNVNLQFNMQARDMKFLFSHMYKTMHIIPFALKWCALKMWFWYLFCQYCFLSWRRISALKWFEFSSCSVLRNALFRVSSSWRDFFSYESFFCLFLFSFRLTLFFS